jgi:hypothetical protein
VLLQNGHAADLLAYSGLLPNTIKYNYRVRDLPCALGDSYYNIKDITLVFGGMAVAECPSSYEMTAIRDIVLPKPMIPASPHRLQ